MKNKKHPIVCFEGVDGSGKTTLSKRLTELCGGAYLKSPPDEIKNTRHLISGAGDSITFHHYIYGNAAAGLKAKELSVSKPVFLDRYHYSTRAYHYQVIKDGAKVPDLPEEDLIVFLHADWETIEKRLGNRNDRKPHENIENLKKIFEKYEEVLSKKNNVLKIDTSIHSVEDSIRIVLERLNKNHERKT